MFTNVEKIEINFPDFTVKRILGVGYNITVPSLYIGKDQKGYDDCIAEINGCLQEHDVSERYGYFVTPLSASAFTKEACARKLINQIRREDVRRLQTSFENSTHVPQEGVVYYPVYADDFFHYHGDPDIFDCSPVECVSCDGMYLNEDELRLAEAFGIARTPKIAKDKETIAFELDYGDRHAHLINAETLRNRLLQKNP